MKLLIFFVLIVLAHSKIYDDSYYQYYDEDDYVTSREEGYEENGNSTPLPPIYKEGGQNDIRIDKIPICNDKDNIGCQSVYLQFKNLQSREKIYLDGVGFLYLDYATEDNGIHSLVYNGEGDITAYFTYSGNSVVGTIDLQDGKVLKIMSISEQKQVSSLIDVPHSIKTEDDEDEESVDPSGSRKPFAYSPSDQQLLSLGKLDSKSIVKVTVTVYYNADAEKKMMFVTPRMYAVDLVQKVNFAYRKSNVPIKLTLHEVEKTKSDKLSGEGISKICKDYMAGLDDDKWEAMSTGGKLIECNRLMIAEFRKSKGAEGKLLRNRTAQAERIRMGANIAVLLVNEIPDWPDFCGKASNIHDIARFKVNLAVVSISPACLYTFGHEIGHLFGLSHQKGPKGSNVFFPYGHGYEIPKEQGDNDGTRTIMATPSYKYKKRLNVFSNPEEGTGKSGEADSVKVLRETRYIAASTNNAKDTVTLVQHTCKKSSNCVTFASCSDLVTPKTFLQMVCDEGKVCCQNSECVGTFPEIEHKKNGWFLIGNRQDNQFLTVGEKKEDGIFSSVVDGRKEGNKKQTWKWEGDLLVSQWNTDYVYDGSVSPYTVQKRSGSKYQNWRFSDGALVNLGWCSRTQLIGGMSIASKWFRVDTEKQSNTNEDHGPRVSINTYLCKKDESCIDIAHCYEAIPVNTMKKKFCDKGRVCCKNKVCHDVAKFEKVEAKIQGWFVIESLMNKNLLTVKDNTASDRQQVVNSRPGLSMFGQVWSWKEGYIVSKLDKTLALDGAFGKVSVKKKTRGNIFQKWRQSGEFLINAGHCEVLDVAHANTDNDALVTIWSVHEKSHQKWTMKPVKFKQGHWKLV